MSLPGFFHYLLSSLHTPFPFSRSIETCYPSTSAFRWVCCAWLITTSPASCLTTQGDRCCTQTHTHIKVTVLSLEFTFTPSHARIRSQYTQICACKGTHMQRYKWRQSEVRRRITVVHQDQSSCLLNWQEEIDYYTLWLMIQNECVCVRACMWVI